MNISDIRIRLLQKEDNTLKAIASMTIDDCFVIHDIKILEGERGLYIKMPSRQTADGKRADIAHPINTPTRDMISKLILDKYQETINTQE